MRRNIRTKRRGSTELFNYSMLDVLACTIGFLLLILFTLTVVSMQLRPPIDSEQQKLLAAVEEQVTGLRSEVPKIRQEYENLKRKLDELQSALEKERWWHNWVKIFLLAFFLLTLSVHLLIYTRWRWLRRGRGIESYGEFVEKGVVRFIVGCHRDYIVIGSSPIEAFIRMIFVLLLTFLLIVTLVVKPSWFLLLPIASLLAIAIFLPFHSTKVPITDLGRGGTPFHKLCDLVQKNEGKCKILLWVYPGGGRSFHAAFRVMKECGIKTFSMNISE